MLARICRGLPHRTMTAKRNNPDFDDGNPDRPTALGNACVREHNRLGLAYENEEGFRMSRATKIGV